MKPQRILFIGAGRMARAIITGIVQQGDWEITVANRSNAARLDELQSLYRIKSTKNWVEDVANFDVIVLAVSPDQHSHVLDVLTRVVTGQLIVTLAAGIGTAQLEAKLPAGTPVAWVMPNTAANIGESITLYSCGTYVLANHREVILRLVQGLGRHEECTDQQIRDLTAITGSAPAFVYEMAETFLNMTVDYGIEWSQAKILVGQMILGCAKMLLSGADPMLLADEVTSPGGSTAAGRDILFTGEFQSLLQRAIVATNQRAAELSEQ